MATPKVRFRRPTADEPWVLSARTIRLLECRADRQRCDQLLTEPHYLKNAHLVGEQWRCGRLVIRGGKPLRHAGIETFNAVNGRGRWLGSTLGRADSNEIPAARVQLAKLDGGEKIVVADAAHTQVETARQILYDQGGEDLLTVTANPKAWVRPLDTRFTQRPFSPSPHGAHPRGDTGTQPRAGGASGLGRAGRQARDGGLAGRADRGARAPAGAAAREDDDRGGLADQQPELGGIGRGGPAAAQGRLWGD